MAEEKDNQEESSQEKANESGNKLLLVIILVLLLFLLIIGGLVAYFLLSGSDETNPQEQQKIEKQHKINSMTDIGPIYPLDTFIANLAASDAKRYLKCKIDLELDSPELQQEVDKKIPPIRDAIIGILTSKTIEEIQTLKGKEKLKEEIKRKVNSLLTTGEIKNVYFTEFVIQ